MLIPCNYKETAFIFAIFVFKLIEKIMYNHLKKHTFHIPVMGTGYTIDTPARVAHLGISSVISLVDDMLTEKFRELHNRRMGKPFQAISDKIDDFRAKRITAFLNTIDEVVQKKFAELKISIQKKSEDFEKYIETLPDFAELKERFAQAKLSDNWTDFVAKMQENMQRGSIDVNIMTKLDKPNFKDGKRLPDEYNDAHAALRGFANSNLDSSIVFSAGMNPRLYTYIEKFDDFFPDKNGYTKKRIILKVSDYRSAQIQSKFLAKKGIWVSEFRIESGLNCGGHAFASDGILVGQVLEEYKEKREELTAEMKELYFDGLKNTNRNMPSEEPKIRITYQGGVGTAEEHQFLLNNYGIESVGWGTPFLLVPEAVAVDKETLQLLSAAKEDDLYLSEISPLGVLFNNLKNNTRDIEKEKYIQNGTPGYPCTKKYLTLNTEYSGKQLCTASRQYQKIKIAELVLKNLKESEFEKEYQKITVKSCICAGLGSSALISEDLDTRVGGKSVSICPGPNLAYFTKIVPLKTMIDHIYGRVNIITQNDRPNFLIKEAGLYIEYLKNKIQNSELPMNEKVKKGLREFKDNIKSGLEYYSKLFSENNRVFDDKTKTGIQRLAEAHFQLSKINIENSIEPVKTNYCEEVEI